MDSTAIPKTDTLQYQDSTARRDSLQKLQMADSVEKKPTRDSGWQINPALPFSVQNFNHLILQQHPYFGFSTDSLSIRPDIRKFQGKELIFYTLILLLLIYAFLRQAFPKYFNDLFRFFFRTSVKQRQISEQLIQTPLPSLLLNGFFVVSCSLYISLILEHYRLNPAGNFWLLSFYCCLGLSAVYFIKFLMLRISGWLFNMQETINSYIFIVFIINKMLGIFLLPFLILLAFTQGNIFTVALTLSWFMIAGLLAYRFILTYAAVHNEVKVNPFHFFLYLCAFEIAPLLLIYKGLLFFFHITA